MIDWTATQTVEAVRAGEVSCAEVINSTLERCARVHPATGCFVELDAVAALRRAAAVDRLTGEQRRAHPLVGLPYAYKDVFVHGGRAPGVGQPRAHLTYRATEARSLVDTDRAGGIAVGRLSLDPLGYTTTGLNGPLGDTRNPVPVMPADDMTTCADLVVECAPSAIFDDIARPVLAAGRDLVVLSSGALLEHWDLVELARRTGGRILVPSGALLGLDAVQAAAQSGGLRSVRMTTRKPAASLLGAPYLTSRAEELATLTEPALLFEGTAREAIEGFPANLNVAVALSLAGLGPEHTSVEIWADPDLDRNTHRIDVEADSASFSMTIANVPSENPKTGRITALSVIALLRKLRAPLRIGT